MIFECFARPKARDLSVPADDVLLHLPGRMTGVFDGASDNLGRKIGGVPIGRLAAAAAANAAAQLPADATDWPAADILNHLSTAVGAAVRTKAGQGPASTTALIAFEGHDSVRLVGIGDTGYRINGGDVYVTDLAPDRVTIPARVAVFKHLQDRGVALHGCETLSQRCIGAGFATAVTESLLPQIAADQIIEQVLRLPKITPVAGAARQLLDAGLQSQFRFANAPDTDLSYGVLNGTAPDLQHVIDVQIPYNDLASVEMFTDGYLTAPSDVTIAAWEAMHAAIERDDPHKIASAMSVKGSTDTQFFDDRTVAILRLRRIDATRQSSQ